MKEKPLKSLQSLIIKRLHAAARYAFGLNKVNLLSGRDLLTRTYLCGALNIAVQCIYL